MKTLLKKFICRLNLVIGGFDDVLFLLGEGRSGTTWVQEVLNFDGKYREMFEPFNGLKQLKLDYRSHYLLPDKDNKAGLTEHISAVGRGDFLDTHISRSLNRIFYQGLIIKDISAHIILDDIAKKAQHEMAHDIATPFCSIALKY